MKPFPFAAALMLALSACLAQATPLTTNAPSGYAGDTVTVVLSEPTPDSLLGITINFSYDSSILTYISGAAGAVGDADPLRSLVLDLGAAGSGTASIAYGTTLDGAADGGSLLELTFTIAAGAAPGTTLVNFSCFDYGPGVGCVDYAFDSEDAPVTILQRTGTPIPLPGTLPLLGLGVAALWGARRRRA